MAPSLTTSRAARIVWSVAAILLIITGVRYFRSRPENGSVRPVVVQSRPPVEPTAPTPHTVVLQEIMSAKEGERKGMLLTVALRGDGASVERVDYRMSRSAEVKRLIFLPREEFIQTDEVKGTFSRSIMSKRQREPRQQCLASSDGTIVQKTERVDGTEKINGYSTFVIRGDYGSTWLAPDLSCAQLRSRIEFDGGWNERRVVSVTVGEPTPDLFETGGLKELVRTGVKGGAR